MAERYWREWCITTDPVLVRSTLDVSDVFGECIDLSGLHLVGAHEVEAPRKVARDGGGLPNDGAVVVQHGQPVQIPREVTLAARSLELGARHAHVFKTGSRKESCHGKQSSRNLS